MTAIFNLLRIWKIFAVGINSVMTRMSSRGEGTNIVILDACRNNPLPATTRGAGSGGLSRMSAPNGSFVAYAADPGAVAFDGDGQNGIFTGSLLAELKTPDRPLISIMRKVRAAWCASPDRWQTDAVDRGITGRSLLFCR